LPNPFDAPHQRQPVQSVLTVSKGLVPPDLPLVAKTLNRYVGLEDEATGHLICVQWSDLQPAAKDGTVRATANYLTDLPARTNRRLKLFGPLKFPIPTASISVQEDKQQKAVVVRTGRLGVRLAGAGSQSPPLLAVCRLQRQLGKDQIPPSGSLPWHGRSTFANTGGGRPQDPC
jgi:hypothetical protein